MASKSFRIEFWQLGMAATANYSSVAAILEAAMSSKTPVSANTGSFVREIRDIQCNSAKTWYRGCLVKLRDSDLPTVGKIGGQESKLQLKPGEGLLEKNFFYFEKKNNILMWQSNKSGSWATALSATLYAFSGIKINLGVVTTSTAAQRLLAGEGILKKYHVNIARPTNPDLYPKGNKMTDELAQLLAAGGGDRITVEASVDGRLKKGSVGLSDVARKALAALSEYVGTTSAKAEIINDSGELEPLDLMRDRIFSDQMVELDGRYPDVKSMHTAFQRARKEQDSALQGVFGDGSAHQLA